MAVLRFEDLAFSLVGGAVKVTFLKIFTFDLEKESLGRISPFSVASNSITFRGVSEKHAQNKLNQLLHAGFQNLRNKINSKPAVYIHQHSGIPLIGHIAFGIVDRDTSIIEVRPITSCNIECIYCSVDEDKRPVDFVVEKDYLVKELGKLAALKNCELEVNIGTQGEPFLYAPIVELIMDIAKIPNVKTISINTNGTFLTERLVDELAKAGLTRINLSVNAMDAETAKKIAGTKSYDINRIKRIIPYIQEKMDIIIAPVWIPGINDAEIPKIIEFCKLLDRQPRLMIQNFLNYRFGRNPVKAVSWGAFEEKLRQWEDKHEIKLRYDMHGEFGIKKSNLVKDPFRRGEIVKADIICPGRLVGESIGVARERAISVKGRLPKGPTKLKVTKMKDHLVYAEPI
ncbi:MAG TPA: radical SAM protein [Candidatus Nanoarchaeia archaeon]|nr:radical SAM protein [Candidatus Nanoarchaeia archaeon]